VAKAGGSCGCTSDEGCPGEKTCNDGGRGVNFCK
jgi:hypothetical protein